MVLILSRNYILNIFFFLLLITITHNINILLLSKSFSSAIFFIAITRFLRHLKLLLALSIIQLPIFLLIPFLRSQKPPIFSLICICIGSFFTSSGYFLLNSFQFLPFLKIFLHHLSVFPRILPDSPRVLNLSAIPVISRKAIS